MNTQPRKQRAGWLSMGWLTDKELAEEIRIYQKDLCEATGVKVPMSTVLFKLLRAGLESTRPTR